MVNADVYKKIRILAIERNIDVSALVEESLRDKLEAKNKQPLDNSSKLEEFIKDYCEKYDVEETKIRHEINDMVEKYNVSVSEAAFYIKIQARIFEVEQEKNKQAIEAGR